MYRSAEDRDMYKFTILELLVFKGEDRNLYCSLCNSNITTLDERIEKQNKHEHVFMNTTRRIYRIGCFKDAIGCAQVGTSTEECTWFTSFAWKYAICAHCHIHLGWMYHSPTNASFFGLILNRLVSTVESSRN